MTGLNFLYGERLLALLIIPAIAILYVILSGRQSRARNSTQLSLVIPKDPAWKRHSAVLLALLSLGSLIVAWAVPTDYAKTPRDRATIVLTIDVSWSMEAEDVTPSRIAAAQESARAFINSLPENFNVGLVTFSGVANVAVPPTIDRGVLLRAIDAMQVGPATATGEGIYTSLEALRLAPPDPNDPEATPPAAIVLLADGATNLGRNSETAAETAKEWGVPVYAIAYGTPNGFVEADGEKQPVAVDDYELYRIAELSGGKKFKAESAGQLAEVYQAISSEVGYERVPVEVTDRYAGLAIFFAIAAALGVISLGARWP